jgi:prolyl 4-hydroxylase
MSIAGDCFELGRQLYNNQDYAHAESWFRQALKKDSEEDVSSVSRLEVLEYLEFTTFKLGTLMPDK